MGFVPGRSPARLVPVNKLLPELLSKVLEHQTGESELVAVTYVCQYWRFTFISSSSLWNRVEFLSRRKLDWPFTHLERSKSALTDVDVNVWPSKTRTLKRFASRIQRTGQPLVIRGEPRDVLSAARFFRKPALSLQ